MNPIIDRLRAELPPTFARTAVPKLTGEIISAGTLANEDSRGTGPAGVFYMGRRAVYEREAFLAWLEAKLTRAKAKPVNRAA
ncbi:hypothetical protein NNJEOMEG_00160 [Fundidesulfovibrio magnetotacticus]|uniref:Uncharacterized protein n=1 Tax=Fundidesulfovibrio magnetotacticus TaxID=2730080 RepID=A0A6V8LRD7_9BACT|nr:hypothetical protein [Fundidesulfovibrio magnetotacticus]GFK92336.1 hypothetical protein NNJEOMEG_00160 [Fundidesulfovibrio magnetotacticus]